MLTATPCCTSASRTSAVSLISFELNTFRMELPHRATRHRTRIVRRLLLPAFRQLRAASDHARLVAPMTVDLGKRAVFLPLRDDLDRIALLFDHVFGVDELR